MWGPFSPVFLGPILSYFGLEARHWIKQHVGMIAYVAAASQLTLASGVPDQLFSELESIGNVPQACLDSSSG